MKEYEKIHTDQEQQLGSIDNVHPMKQVAIMSVVQVLVLAGMMMLMFLIGRSV